MDVPSIEMSAKRLQLLAVDALLEHARAGSDDEESCVRLLQRIVEMGARLELDPASACAAELSKTQIEISEHLLQA